MRSLSGANERPQTAHVSFVTAAYSSAAAALYPSMRTCCCRAALGLGDAARPIGVVTGAAGGDGSARRSARGLRASSRNHASWHCGV